MARLTAAERRNLPASDFADPKNRRFPIEDRAHAIAAERESGHASPEVKARIDKMAGAKLHPGHSARNTDTSSHY